MAPSANKISIFLLLTLLSSLQIHARDGQFFNKVTSTNGDTNTNTVVPETKQPLNNQQSEQPLNTQETEQQQQPDFVPDNENGYGLYGHESGQLPPSTTTLSNTETKQPLHKYLPKNYNPVAYVTVPENVDDSTSSLNEEKSYATNPTNYYNGAQNEEKSYATNPTNYYNGEQNYYNGQQEEEETEFRSYPATTRSTTNANTRNNYNLGSSFNSQPQGLSDTRYNRDATLTNRENYFSNNNGNNANGFQPQGMSDTRALENGKYFYNVNTEKYSSNHPYESLRGVRPTNEQYSNRNYYSNSENVNEFSNENNYMGGYQNQEEFQNEDNNMP